MDINHFDPTTKPIKTKDYNICKTCAANPDLENKLRNIFYIPLSIHVRK